MPNETPTNPSENRTGPVIPEETWEQRYYQLRTSIRNAAYRMNGYKLGDTALIAEYLKETGDVSTATQMFADLLRDVEREAYKRGCNDTTDQYGLMLDEAQETERRLRETIRTAINTLTPEALHTGGIVRPKSLLGELTPEMFKPHEGPFRYVGRDHDKSDIVASAVKGMLGER